MEVRRAILLFVIVLGIAAVVTVLSGPRDGGGESTPAPAPTALTPSTPTARPGPADPGERAVRFDTERASTTRRATAGRPLTVIVDVAEAGEVNLTGLGLTEAAEPDDPARFDVLPSAASDVTVEFVPAGQSQPRTVGKLAVGPAD